MVQTTPSLARDDRSEALGDEFVLGQPPAPPRLAQGATSLRDLLGWDVPSNHVDVLRSLARLAIVMSLAMVFVGIGVMFSVNVVISIIEGVVD